MQTPEHDTLSKFIHEATMEVFSMMLGLEVDEFESHMQSEANPMTDGVVSLIGLTGPWIGTGSLLCSAEFACRVSGALVGAEATAVDHDVLDAFGEVTNMIIGNVKTRLEELAGPLGLSIPTVVYGRNFAARTMGSMRWTVVKFHCGGDVFEVQLCLAQNQNGDRPRLSFAGHLSSN